MPPPPELKGAIWTRDDLEQTNINTPSVALLSRDLTHFLHALSTWRNWTASKMKCRAIPTRSSVVCVHGNSSPRPIAPWNVHSRVRGKMPDRESSKKWSGYRYLSPNILSFIIQTLVAFADDATPLNTPSRIFRDLNPECECRWLVSIFIALALRVTLSSESHTSRGE